MAQKETDNEQQREAFREYLNEVSEKVSAWEPWERGILGTREYDAVSSKEGNGCSVDTVYHESNPDEG